MGAQQMQNPPYEPPGFGFCTILWREGAGLDFKFVWAERVRGLGSVNQQKRSLFPAEKKPGVRWCNIQTIRRQAFANWLRDDLRLRERDHRDTFATIVRGSRLIATYQWMMR
jgi:hypothetical protein